MKNKVIVIGAGIGGMTSALLLASKGYDITIIEKIMQLVEECAVYIIMNVYLMQALH